MNGTKFCYPNEDTWFICWEETRTTIKSYGGILTTQCMESPYIEVDYYTDESEWLAILMANGINPLPEELINE